MFSRILPKQTLYVSIARGRIKYFVARRPYHTRAGAILSLLVGALHGGPVPDQRFLVNIGDRPRRGYKLVAPYRMYGPAAAEGCRDVAAPDFVFGGWPEAGLPDFELARAAIGEDGRQCPETSLMGWYGDVRTIDGRRRLVEIGKQRPDLIEAVNVGDWFGRGERLAGLKAGTPGKVLGMGEQVRRYRFLIDVEGVGYSGRLKLLLHSGRVVFIQERPWREWFFDRLRAWDHYVPVKRDLSDLVANIEKVSADPQLARHIGEGGRRFADEYLTRDAAVAVWRKLLRSEEVATSAVPAAQT